MNVFLYEMNMFSGAGVQRVLGSKRFKLCNVTLYTVTHGMRRNWVDNWVIREIREIVTG